MAEKMNQKKLIQAFRTFFQKSITPYVSSNQVVMNQWKYFYKLMTSDPIDYSQIQLYSILANKAQNSPHSPQSEFRTGNFGQAQRINQAFYLPPSNKALITTDRKNINNKVLISPKKKSLVTSLENFQSQLLKNQQKLQLFVRKETGANQTTISGSNRKYY